MDGLMSQKPAMEEAMTEVLQHLTKVSEFLRNAGHNDGANHVARLSIELVNAFYNASAELASAELESPELSEAQAVKCLTDKVIALHLSKKSEKNMQGQTQPHPARAIPIAESPRAITEAPENRKDDVQHIQDIHLDQHTAPRRVNDLARVAAEPENRIPISVSEAARALCDLRSSFSTEGESLLESRQSSVQSRNEGLQEGFAGVVHIYGDSTRSDFISFITSSIKEGPIYELSVTSPKEAILIFQYTLHAQILIDRNQESLVLNNTPVLGPGYAIALGEPLEWHETLRRMEHPMRERRRLTFARAKLFGEQLPCKKWQREIADIAGASNVDFTWVFNSGNATAVFRSTGIARKVFHTFQSWKVNRPVYRGLDVSFSADPCEKELVLTTQLRQQPPAHWKTTPPN